MSVSLTDRELRLAAMQALAGRADWLEERPAKTLASSFQILNLVKQQHQLQPADSVPAVDEEGE